MKDPQRPLLWHQGQFLQPQHFQQFDLQLNSRLTSSNQLASTYNWGVNRCQIQETALGEGRLTVERVDLLFPDGTRVVFPGNAQLQPRLLPKIETGSEEVKPFRVYLGLKKMRPTGNNVSEFHSEQELHDINTRFVSAGNPSEVEDTHLGGPTAQVRFMEYALRIFWETEVERLGDYHLLPLAQLELDGDQIRLVRDYIPPATALADCETLLQIVKNIQEQLQSRASILEMYKIFRDVRTSEIDPVSLRYLLALTTVNRYLPILQHLTETPTQHPWQLYGLLRQLVGELSTFSDRIDTLGRLPDGTELVPAYNHQELGFCFNSVRTLISELLSAIVVGEENVVQLVREDADFSGRIPPEAFSDRMRCYLAVSAAGEADGIVNTLLHHAKFASREEMATMLARALPGVPLERKATPPPGLPQRADAYYFNLEMNHPLWLDIRRTGNVTLHWDEAPEDAIAQLIISRS